MVVSLDINIPVKTDLSLISVVNMFIIDYKDYKPTFLTAAVLWHSMHELQLLF